MSEATLIYPHQLYTQHPALEKKRPVYLVEEPLLLTEFPVHTQKLLLHRLSMQAYKTHLEKQGHEVRYLDSNDLDTSETVFKTIAEAGITTIHVVDTTDTWLEKRISKYCKKYDLTTRRYESPLFVLEKQDAIDRYQKSNKHLQKFYKQLRIDTDTLIVDSDQPQGGSWSFDSENRKKLPADCSLPPDITCYTNSEITAANQWLDTITAKKYGSTQFWLPYTHESAEKWLQDFLKNYFSNFGTYEDALTTKHVRVFHSTLSPLLNIGLLAPQQVLDTAIAYAENHSVDINNLEGFVRQILGWREFIRAAYECDGTSMRTKNFWQHSRPLPDSFWSAETAIPPLDTAITNALQYGYGHHIERLMVLGNFMLLRRTDPDEVYRWFMAMYVDAYDWVMVPNVYGMSQFADGGIFATKPYISGSNYIRKMSDYPTGDWEDVWTALYWEFIATHTDFFTKNHRLSMMPRLYEKMTAEKKEYYSKIADTYL